MSFMKLYASRGVWYVVETVDGTCIVPGDVAGDCTEASDLSMYCHAKPLSFECVDGWCARYSAAGYLDCTEWVGPYATKAEAVRKCETLYGDDDDAEDGIDAQE